MEVTSKMCSKCGVDKPITEFYKHKTGRLGVRSYCIPCFNEQSKESYQSDKDAYHERHKRWITLNRDKCVSYCKRWEDKNREYVNAKKRERRATCPTAAVADIMRSRLNSALGGSRKSTQTLKLLGVEFSDFMKWIEFQFLDDRMNWETRGTYWEVDHTLPLCKFDMTKPANQEVICNAINLRPLSKEENREKNGKLIPWLHVCQEVKWRHFNKHCLNDKYDIVNVSIEPKV